MKLITEDDAAGKKLLIMVKERPLVKEVDFRGGTEVGLSTVKSRLEQNKLTIRQDAIYDPVAVRKVKELIVETCGEKGFWRPLIEVHLEPMGPTTSRLVFTIKEGGKVRIHQVRFRGNQAIPSPALARALTKTRKHGLFSRLTGHDLLVDKHLEADLLNVKKAYWRIGYKEVFVGAPTLEIKDFTSHRQSARNKLREGKGKSPKYDLRAFLTIPIQEGEVFFEGTFKVEGNDEVMKGKAGEAAYRMAIAEARQAHRPWLARFFAGKPALRDASERTSQVFDLDALDEGLEKVRGQYHDLGHIQFRADKVLAVRETDGLNRVDVTLKVQEGELYTVRRIAFEGNTTSKDKVLRRALLLKESEPFRVGLLRDSFTSLGQLGFFKVNPDETKVDLVVDRPQVDLTLKGEEAGVNEVTFQSGYGSSNGLYLGGSFSTRNLGGGGETLSVAANAGKYERMAAISFVEPYIFDRPFSFTATLSDSVKNFSLYQVGHADSFREATRGLSLSLGTRLATFIPGPSWAFFTTYQAGYTFQIHRLQGEGSSYFARPGNHLASFVNQTLTYSTVNHPFKPTRGLRLAAGFDYGGWQFGGDTPFHRTTLGFTQWQPLSDRQVLGLNASYGYVRNLTDRRLAYWDLFRLGGENSIRGYQFGQIGTTAWDDNGKIIFPGGNKQFSISAEYQFKVAEPFRVVLFHDAGNAWAEGVKSFSEPLRRSIGVELRLFIPISPAPLRFIWSKKLNPYPSDPEGRYNFQFAFGTAF